MGICQKTLFTLFAAFVAVGSSLAADPLGIAIYNQATPKQRCQIEVLQKKLGMRLMTGTPQAPKSYDESRACDYTQLSDAQVAGEMDIYIRNADEFLASLDSWLNSHAALCGFKYRVSQVAKKSVDTLHANMQDQFVDATSNHRTACYAEGASRSLLKPDSNGLFCMAAALSASSFIECFRKGDCYADCAVGAQAAELNLMYDVYDENNDGILSPREKELFDLAYSPEETVVGRWDISSTEGLYATKNTFHGKNSKKVGFIPKGTQTFVGAAFVLHAKDSYKKQVNLGQIDRRGGWANLAQNGMIVSVSPGAVNEIYQNELDQQRYPQANSQEGLYTLFEKYYGELRNKALNLSYGHPGAVYEQLMTKESFAGIIDGSYRFKNATAQDLKTIEEMRLILNRPVFREVEVYVHPYGRLTLANLMVKMMNYHIDANASFETYRSSINTLQFEKYRDIHVLDCLKKQIKTAADN
jgi:hypothetical protein